MPLPTRYTTLTWIERHHGYAIARAYAGHTSKNNTGTTTTYITADLHEVATALADLTGEPHPLGASLAGPGTRGPRWQVSRLPCRLYVTGDER